MRTKRTDQGTMRETNRRPKEAKIRGKQRDPNPKGNSLIRKGTSTYKGFHSKVAASVSYE